MNTTLSVVFSRSHKCSDIDIDTDSIFLFNWGQMAFKNSKLNKISNKSKNKFMNS